MPNEQLPGYSDDPEAVPTNLDEKDDNLLYGTGNELPLYGDIFDTEHDRDVADLLHSTSGFLDIDVRYAARLTTNLVLINSRTGQTVYHAECHDYKKGLDLVLRTQDINGQVVGGARYRWRQDIQMSLGGDGTMQGMSDPIVPVVGGGKAAAVAQEYRFSIPSQMTPGGFRHLVLVQTISKQDGIKGFKNKFAWHNYKLIDSDDGRALGLWLERSTLTIQRGKLHLRTETQDGKPLLDPQEVTWILLAIACVVDKVRKFWFHTGLVLPGGSSSLASSSKTPAAG